MKRLLVSIAALVVAALLVAACGQTAPAPTPTKAPAAATAAPAKAAEATKPAAAPTKAPAAPTATAVPKVEFPRKGGTVTFVVPFAAGGNSDLSTRLLAAFMEKDLGANFVVTNNAGAATQAGTTEVARAKPDGYTLLHISTGSFFSSYLQPDRKATYNLKSFAPVANHVEATQVLSVKADSPFKTAKDLLDHAKANPGKVKIGTSSPLGTSHLAALALERAAGVKFAIVNLGGGAAQVTAILGGHIDTTLASASNMLAQIKTGEIRVLATMGEEDSPYLPGIKTLKSMGYNVLSRARQGTAAAAGTPKEVVDVLDKSIKKALEVDKKKFEDVGLELLYMDAAKYAAFLAEEESINKDLLELAAKSQ